VYEADYTFDVAGQMLTASDGDSDYTYDYNSRGQVQEETQAFGSVTNTFSFIYDSVGNRTAMSDGTVEVDSTYTDSDKLYTLALSTPSLGPNLTMSYDLAGRLSGISRQEGASGNTIDTAYSYDAASRLTDIAHSSSYAGSLNEFAYGYDGANRLVTYTGPE